MTRLLASLILFLASPLWAQVDIVTQTTIYCRTAVPEGAKVSYDWYADAGLTLTPIGNGSAVNPSGSDGTYDGVVVATINGQKTPTAFSVTIGDTPVPPTPATLRELVTDSEAKIIADYLRALATQVGGIRDAEHFWAVWQQTFPVAGNAKLDAALKARIDPALEKKVGLSIELRAIADEFEKKAPEPPTPPVVEPTEKVTAVTYFYDRGKSADIPNGVKVGLSKLNLEKGIRATTHEDGTTDSEGDTPEQYKVGLAAAKESGLPAAVSQVGDRVKRVLPNPQTVEQIWSLAP